MTTTSVLAGLLVLPFVVGFSSAPAADKDDDKGGKGKDRETVLTFADDRIVEGSGLVRLPDGDFVTMNDSGDAARVFTVDDRGETIGVTTWDASAIDIEGLAPAGPGEVWVGDIGDNAENRDAITITRVPVGEGDLAGALASYTFTYVGGARNAESLLVHPITGRLYVASKQLFGKLYEAPEQLSDGVNRLRPIGDVVGIATDGAFFPDGRHLVLRDYWSATIYTFPELEEVAEIELPDQQQGESIAVDEDGTVYVSSEGVHQDVIEVDLPKDLEDLLEEEPEVEEPEVEEPDAVEEPDEGEGPEDAEDAAPEEGSDQWPLVIIGAVVLLAVGALTGRRRR